MFFTLDTWQLALVLAAIMFGATLIGLFARSYAELLRRGVPAAVARS